MHMTVDAYRDQKRALNTLALGLQVALRCQLWVLKNKLGVLCKNSRHSHALRCLFYPLRRQILRSYSFESPWSSEKQ